MKEVALACEVVSLPTKPQGRPLIFGKELDSLTQVYIKNLEVKEQL